MRHHVVSREPGQKGFVVLERRWVVERSFGWLVHWGGLLRGGGLLRTPLTTARRGRRRAQTSHPRESAAANALPSAACGCPQGGSARAVLRLPYAPEAADAEVLIPGFLAQLDRKAAGPYQLPGLRLKPSEYFHRNMACTFMDDEIGLSMRHLVGLENILWSTDFPHPATTWPHSQEIVARQFADIPDDEQAMICCTNAERIYKL